MIFEWMVRGKESLASCGRVLLALGICILCLLEQGYAKEDFQPPQTSEATLALCLELAKEKSVSPDQKAWLIRELTNEDAQVRAAATLALQEAGDPSDDVLQALKDNLDHPVQNTRSVAATALLRLGEKGKDILRARIDAADTLEKRLEALTALRSSLEGLRDPWLVSKMEMLQKEIQKTIYPDPVVLPGAPVQDGAFEKSGEISDWTLRKEGGAEGEMQWVADPHRRVGGSLKLEKTSSDGRVYLRSQKPLKLAPGERAVVRLYYHADDAPENAALQILFEDEQGNVVLGDFHRGHAVLAQNAVRNSAPGEWVKLVGEFPPSDKPRRIFIRIALKGNPATVWIDDISAPAPAYSYFYSAPLQTMPEKNEGTSGESTAPVNASIKKEGNRARLLLNGKPVPPLIYFSYMNNFGEYAGMEALADITLQIVAVEMNSSHQGGLFPPTSPVWPEADRFDFSTPLNWLAFAAQNAPTSRFIIVFNIYWPNDWVEKHPEEAWLNAKGERAYGNSTSALMGFSDKPPPGTQWWPSPFSEKAQAAAEEGIRKFVAELKKSPYAHRVIGAHITGGHDEQFFTESFPDFSRPAQEAFRKWLERKYGSLEMLHKAWHDPQLTFETATIPNPDQEPLESRFFFNPLTERRFVDHRQFQAEQGMVQKIGFARAFKKAMGRPVVAMADQMGEIRNQGMDTVLEAHPDSLDLIAAQPWYERRLPGYSGGIAGSLATLNARGKIGLTEMDLRTWLRAGGNEIASMQVGAAMSPKIFRNMFRKEAAPMIATGNGYWMFDIGTTHWRDPEMLRTIADGTRAYKELELDNPTPFQPEVALVWDDASIYWMADTIHETLSYWKRFERYTILGLRTSGVPFDEVALDDLLSRIDSVPYKVLIFPNAFVLTPAQRKAIADKLQKKGRVLIWNYAAGYIGEESLSNQGIRELTGLIVDSEEVTQAPEMRFVTTEDAFGKGLSGIPGMGEFDHLLMRTGIDPYTRVLPKGFRRFIINDPDATPLAIYRDGKVAMAVRRFPEWTSIYSGMLGGLDAGLLRNAAREAKATILTSRGVVVDFNGRFLSLHGVKNGPVEVTFPFDAVVSDFDTGETVARGATFALPIKAGETSWFSVEKMQPPKHENEKQNEGN